MLFLINLIMCIMTLAVAGPIESIDTIPYNVNETLKPTRRILQGREVGDTRPYMVQTPAHQAAKFLQPFNGPTSMSVVVPPAPGTVHELWCLVVYLRSAPNADPKFSGSDWICGGVIIHERYILTSAACIEDAKHFYVVSGTHKWVPLSEKNNECINNGAKKAVWKCVPKSYVYDGDEFDNIRWMIGDIAVVKVEDAFNFEKRVRGCDFIPKKVDYNNRSADLEKQRSFGSIAGWGSTDTFGDIDQDPTVSSTDLSTFMMLRTSKNSPELMETDVQLVNDKNCKKRWEPRYHFIIDEHMVCTKDITDDEAMSSLCLDREVNCKELQYSDSEDDYEDEDAAKPASRRMVAEPGQLQVHTGVNFQDTRRKNKVPTGGFCENDHGGPLIVGQGKSSVVIGVMSACLTRDISKKCYGPFLFTSVYRYRNLITCAIDKDIGSTCRKLLRTSKTPMAETDFDWSNHNADQKLAFREGKKEMASEKEARGQRVQVATDVLTKEAIPGPSPSTKLPKK